MRFIDLTGQVFGQLTVIRRAETRKRCTYWLCRCECGQFVDAGYGGLVNGRRTDCGHIDPALTAERFPWPSDPRVLVGRDGSLVGPMGRLLRPWLDERGYPRVTVYEPGRPPRQPSVHAMVCETFHGPRPAGMEVAHEDGNRENSHAGNLSWKTHVENEADKLAHGTRPQGERVYCAKLTEQDVHAIRAAVAAGESLTDLSLRYPVAISTLSRVALRKTWKHVA